MGRKVKETDVAVVNLDNDGKDITSIKLDGLYYPVVMTDKKIYIGNAGFGTALLAYNQGRSVKKQHAKPSDYKSEENTKEQNNTKVRTVRLWTEGQMISRPDICFRETWVITDPNGFYAHSYLNGQSKDIDGVIRYTPALDIAQRFNTYEDATQAVKVLNTNVKVGHKLKRFYLPQGNS